MRIDTKLKKQLDIVRENKHGMRKYLMVNLGYNYDQARETLRLYKKSRKK